MRFVHGRVSEAFTCRITGHVGVDIVLEWGFLIAQLLDWGRRAKTVVLVDQVLNVGGKCEVMVGNFTITFGGSKKQFGALLSVFTAGDLCQFEQLIPSIDRLGYQLER